MTITEFSVEELEKILHEFQLCDTAIENCCNIMDEVSSRDTFGFLYDLFFGHKFRNALWMSKKILIQTDHIRDTLNRGAW